jgi:DNA-binding CsgD family transcriptional regulator
VARLEKDGERLGYAALYREPVATEFDAAVVESFLSLAPHLTRALALAMRMAAAETTARRCAQCTDMLPFGCLLLDDTGTVLESNTAADEMLGAGDGLRMIERRIHALRAADDAMLARKLADVISNEALLGPAFVTVPRPTGRRPHALVMIRMEVRRAAFTGRVPRLRLVMVDGDRDGRVPREVLRALYQLTEMESRVAWQLAGGDSLEQAADRLGIAHSTVRHHLERIFVKTGAHRQSDLVRLVHAPFVSIGGAR